MSHATTVVEIAKDSIRTLTSLNQTTDIYRRQQIAYNYFLVSALAVLFLASCHAPVQFSPICREEFFMALDLVKGFSERSLVSKRLWSTIKNLKEIGPRLGLSAPAVTDDDAHATAAIAMAGMAGQTQGHTPTSMQGQSLSPCPPPPTQRPREPMGFGKVMARHESFAPPSITSNPAEMISTPMTSHPGSVGETVPGVGSTWESPVRTSSNQTGRHNGFQLSHEMTSLFEAAMGSANKGPP